jgi:hypothetical protein
MESHYSIIVVILRRPPNDILFGLSEFDLVRRKVDPLDRRSVLVQRTAAGMAFLRDLKKILDEAGGETDKTPGRTRRPVAV